MANQLADQNLLLANLYVIHESEARPGNIVAYPGGKDLGHTGILLGHNLYISARDDEDHQTRPAKSFQVVDGIQIKMLDPGTKTFRRFSYGFEFEFEFANYLESRRFYIPGNRFQVTVNAHYKTTVDHSTTDYLQVSLVRMSDGDHSECNLQVGGKVTCSWRKQQPGAYYMILKKAPISGRLVTADILEGNGEVTANGN